MAIAGMSPKKVIVAGVIAIIAVGLFNRFAPARAKALVNGN